MKKRLLSAIVMLLIVIPVILAGGKAFSVAVGLLSIIALKELIDLRNSHNKIPSYLTFFSVITLLILVFYIYPGHTFSYGVSQRLLILMFIGFLLPSLLYYDDKSYQTKDAFYLFGIVVFLGLSFNSLILIRESNIYLLFYLILCSTLTDIFAYLMGSMIGKRKIFPHVSPNKTLEGCLSGLLLGSIGSSIYYFYFVEQISILSLIIMSLCLSLTAIFGDLLFSKIKRENNIKDYSKLIPGHGGILDRLDSFLWIVLVYVLLIKFI